MWSSRHHHLVPSVPHHPTASYIPPSPSLIDFTNHPPPPTLLDEQDEYGFPPPEFGFEPYRDNFSDSGSGNEGGEGEGDSRSSGEREVERLLDVVPTPRAQGAKVQAKQEVLRRKDTTGGGETSVQHGPTDDGTICINLPDGSGIAFRPPSGAVATNNQISTSLAQPAVATSAEEAFETIKRLALLGTAARAALPAAESKRIARAKLSGVEAGVPPLPTSNRPPQVRLAPSPWPILASARKPSRLKPTAAAFKPTLQPISSSTATSLANSTESISVYPSSRTSPDTHIPPYPAFPIPTTSSSGTTSTQSAVSDSAVIITPPEEIEGLFKWDIKPIPWVEVEFPYNPGQKRKKKGINGQGQQVQYVPQTKAQIDEKISKVLASFGDPAARQPPTHSAASLWPEGLEESFKETLAKRGVAPYRPSLALQDINTQAPDWRQFALPPPTTVTPPSPLYNTYHHPPTSYCPTSITVPSHHSAPNLVPAQSQYPLIIEDQTHPHTSLDQLHLHNLDPMTGVPTYDWRGDVGQPVQPSQRTNRLAGERIGYIGVVPSHPVADAFAETSQSANASSSTNQRYEPLIQRHSHNKERLTSSPVAPYDRLLSLPSARQNVPSHLQRSSDTLQNSMMTSWIAAEPSEDQKRYVAALAARLTRLINQEFGTTYGLATERFTVDVFGSVSWGGETGKGGDVDMVVRDSHYPQGYHPSLWIQDDTVPEVKRSGRQVNTFRSDISPLYDLHNLVILLRRRGYSEVLGIYGATTPIAKFKDPSRPGMEADVNVNDLGGWYNSRLILAYCEISPHVLRPLIHALKLWSKRNYINDPSGKNGTPTMSSYCLTLMAIGYLQHLGVLPNLQRDVEVRVPDHPETEDRDVIWAGWGRKSGTKINVGFSETAPAGWQPRGGITAAEALRGFFAYFSRTNPSNAFQYNTQVVSILNGGMMPRARTQGQETQEAQQRKLNGTALTTREEMLLRESTMGKGDRGVQPRNWGERRLVVQDPFIWQKNCTQAMSKLGLDRWLNAVDRAHETLTRFGDQCSLDFLLNNALPPPPGVMDISPHNGRMPSLARGGYGRGSPRGRGRAYPFPHNLFSP